MLCVCVQEGGEDGSSVVDCHRILLRLLPHMPEGVLRLAAIAIAFHGHWLRLFTGLIHRPGRAAAGIGGGWLLVFRLRRLLRWRRVIVVAYQLDGRQAVSVANESAERKFGLAH